MGKMRQNLQLTLIQPSARELIRQLEKTRQHAVSSLLFIHTGQEEYHEITKNTWKTPLAKQHIVLKPNLVKKRKGFLPKRTIVSKAKRMGGGWGNQVFFHHQREEIPKTKVLRRDYIIVCLGRLWLRIISKFAVKVTFTEK